MKLYRLTANEDQIKTILYALNCYSRLGIGQLKTIFQDFGFVAYDQFKNQISDICGSEIDESIDLLKMKIFNLKNQSSYLITDEVVNKTFKIAYDIYSNIKPIIDGDKLLSEYKNIIPQTTLKFEVIEIDENPLEDINVSD